MLLPRTRSLGLVVALGAALLLGAGPAHAKAKSKVKGRAPAATKPSTSNPGVAPKPKPDAKADQAYAEAKAQYLILKGDEKRRALRHNWLNAAKLFVEVASKYRGSERAPEALYTAGGLYDELSRISANLDDQHAARQAYEKLIQGWPDHRLRDDASFALARLLADRASSPGDARTVVESALARSPGDRQKDLQKLLAALPAPKPQVARRRAEPVTRDVEADEPVVVAKAEPKVKSEPAAAASPSLAQAFGRALSDVVEPHAHVDEGHAVRSPIALRAELPDDEKVEPDAEALEEPAQTSAISAFAEKLRDVRVGQAPNPKDDAKAREWAKQALVRGKGAELSLAEQLGLKFRRVIIDAGHGGHDSGAVGPSGLQEKDIALSISLQVAKLLRAQGLEVLLTRDDDTFVKLEDRAKYANSKQGDLFISIHCNSAPTKKLRGIETYTLNTAADRYSIRLAARENATTERGVGDLRFILADLATKANTGESQRLADRVQRSLVNSVAPKFPGGGKNLGTKEALFYVLLGAKMPAVLVETSFLSNPEEEKLLGNAEYQKTLAGSIAEGITSFLDERNAKMALLD